VAGQCLDKDELDQAVRKTLYNAARAVFDTYHYLQNEKALLSRVEFSPGFQEIIDNSRHRDEGTLVVLPHISNFDLVGYAAAIRGLRILALAFPQPTSGYQWQNDLRTRYGLKAVPTSLNSMKAAVRWMKEGGTVMTGIDRPLPDSKYTLEFFGRQAHLPVHHVMIALRAKVRVFVANVRRRSDDIYVVGASEPVKIEYEGDRTALIKANAQRILNIAEESIRRAPHEWAMYYPVWPQALEEMPQ
jgi:KDO2-lipid IV(A) lauroyltransferase